MQSGNDASLASRHSRKHENHYQNKSAVHTNQKLYITENHDRLDEMTMGVCKLCGMTLTRVLNLSASSGSNEVCVCCDYDESPGVGCFHRTGKHDVFVAQAIKRGGGVIDKDGGKEERLHANINARQGCNEAGSSVRQERKVEEMTTRSPLLGDLCPKCGNATMIYKEGCVGCYDPFCGYSKC